MSDKRRERGEETKQKLVSGVFELAAREGLAGLTAGKLSKATGIGKSTIFHHFSSLDELAIEAMKRWFDRTMEPMETGSHSYTSTDAYLEALGEAMFGMTESGDYFRATMTFFHKALFDESFREIFSPFLMSYMERERKVLARLSGLPVEHQTLVEWTGLMAATLDGISMQVAITQNPALGRAAWKQFSRMFVSALNDARTQGE